MVSTHDFHNRYNFTFHTRRIYKCFVINITRFYVTCITTTLYIVYHNTLFKYNKEYIISITIQEQVLVTMKTERLFKNALTLSES